MFTKSILSPPPPSVHGQQTLDQCVVEKALSMRVLQLGATFYDALSIHEGAYMVALIAWRLPDGRCYFLLASGRLLLFHVPFWMGLGWTCLYHASTDSVLLGGSLSLGGMGVAHW